MFVEPSDDTGALHQETLSFNAYITSYKNSHRTYKASRIILNVFTMVQAPVVQATIQSCVLATASNLMAQLITSYKTKVSEAVISRIR
jgi:hypothetical protein